MKSWFIFPPQLMLTEKHGNTFFSLKCMLSAALMLIATLQPVVA